MYGMQGFASSEQFSPFVSKLSPLNVFPRTHNHNFKDASAYLCVWCAATNKEYVDRVVENIDPSKHKVPFVSFDF